MTAPNYDDYTGSATVTVTRDTADAVIAKISDIGTVTNTDASKQKIDEARKAYDALTDAQKALITNADALTKAETEYTELKQAAEAAEKKEQKDIQEAGKVSDAIGALDTLTDVTADDKTAIEAARDAYNALTEDQKAKIPAETVKKLTDAEDKLAILEVMDEVSEKNGNDTSYTGKPINLIDTPAAVLPEGYTMEYAVTTTDAEPAASDYSPEIPAKTDAGTYYVWFRAVGDADHPAGASGRVIVTIGKVLSAVETPPAALSGLVWTGEPMPLISAGTASGGVMQYALGTDATTVPAFGWSTEIPVAAEADVYYVWYRAAGDANHAASSAACVTVEIAAEDSGEKIPLGQTGWTRGLDGIWAFGDGDGNAVTGVIEYNGNLYLLDENGGMHFGGWQKAFGNWYFATETGELVHSRWLKYGDDWYYFGEDGAMVTGWLDAGTAWYYMKENGAMATGWLQLDGDWRYMGSMGTMTVGWAKIGGKYYFFGGDGVMMTGWLEDNGKLYYLCEDGGMATGWVEYDGAWYYMDAGGAMATGWVKDGGKWFHLSEETGKMDTGWLEEDGSVYFLNDRGVMQTGWVEMDKDVWYWFDESGRMATGWRQIGNQHYFFADDGVWQAP